MNKKSLTKNNKKSKPKRVAHIFSGEEPIVNGGTGQTGAAGAVAGAVSKGKNIGGIIGSVASGIGDIVAAGMANAEVNTTEADNAIDAVEKFKPSSASLDSLTSSYNGLDFANTNNNYKDFMVSNGTALKNMGKAAVSGAMAGSNINVPWGTIAGAAAGLLSAGGGWIAGRVKAEEEAERLNREARRANLAATNKTQFAKDTIMQTQRNDFMQNIASYGGPLHNHTGDWSNGLTFINEGGTHEENPFDGVLIGFDQEGIPNLVEEGEIIYKDYVFSNRLKPYVSLLRDYGFNDKYKDWTFAKIVEDVQKISAENPMDKISLDSLDDMMNTLMIMQEEVRRKKGKIGQNRLMSFGGKKGRIYDGDKDIYTEIGKGFSTGTNPLSLVNGQFVGDIEPTVFTAVQPRFSDVLNPDKSTFDFGQNIPLQDLIADDFEFEDPGLVNVKSMMGQLPLGSLQSKSITGREKLDAESASRLQNPNNSNNPYVQNTKSYKSRTENPINFDVNSLMQAAPIISGAISTAVNAATPIDTSNLIAEEALSDIPEMVLPEVGGKITYKPTDKNAIINTINNQGLATANAIQNTAQTSGQALANLANASYNNQRAVAEGLINADRQDLVGQLQVGQHNAGIDKTNLASSQAEQTANAEIAKLRAMGRIQDAQGLAALQQMKNEATNTAMNTTVQGIADLGRQNMQWDWIRKNPMYAEAVKAIGKNGGMLTKRKRRRK